MAGFIGELLLGNLVKAPLFLNSSSQAECCFDGDFVRSSSGRYEAVGNFLPQPLPLLLTRSDDDLD